MGADQGCQISISTKYQNGKKLPNSHKLYQMSIKYNKRPWNGPSVHEIYQHLPLQDPPKLTQIWIFGLKTNHLATLAPTRCYVSLSVPSMSTPTCRLPTCWITTCRLPHVEFHHVNSQFVDKSDCRQCQFIDHQFIGTVNSSTPSIHRPSIRRPLNTMSTISSLTPPNWAALFLVTNIPLGAVLIGVRLGANFMARLTGWVGEKIPKCSPTHFCQNLNIIDTFYQGGRMSLQKNYRHVARPISVKINAFYDNWLSWEVF
jgi:hypothetical protein